MQEIRWGILGTGAIAKKFAEGVKSLPDAELTAVGSRTAASAEAFGKAHGIPRCFGSYRELAGCPDVDVIYVSTPHSMHRDCALLCLEAGRPVLCEKPFTINAREAADLVRAARRKKLFLMEAMWTRFHPAAMKVRELAAAGTIGTVRMVTADFGFRAGFNADSRLFNPALGGGAMLDVGVYTISLAHMILGKPARVVSMAERGATGVDEQSAFILGYDTGALAILSSAIRTSTPHEAVIIGTEGQIRIHSPFWHPTRFTLARAGKPPQEFDMPLEGNGYNYEAAEVGRCLRAGKLESDVMPLNESVEIMETMDTIRAQWGLKYPME